MNVGGEIMSKGVFFFTLFLAFLSFGASAFEISSPAFKDGERIPIKYVRQGAGGKNISIPISWRGIPAGTKSFALSIVDIHPIANNWVHWLVINIPSYVTRIDEGASRTKMPPYSSELKNSWGKIGYGGPEPPEGTGDHTYVITIYALSIEKLELGPEASFADFTKAIEGKVIDSASIRGKFARWRLYGL
jgi:Raf kinase inhibitor-like YbhB/YbcL family protein